MLGKTPCRPRIYPVQWHIKFDRNTTGFFKKKIAARAKHESSPGASPPPCVAKEQVMGGVREK